jgi:hypothetical protein
MDTLVVEEKDFSISSSCKSPSKFIYRRISTYENEILSTSPLH